MDFWRLQYRKIHTCIHILSLSILGISPYFRKKSQSSENGGAQYCLRTSTMLLFISNMNIHLNPNINKICIIPTIISLYLYRHGRRFPHFMEEAKQMAAGLLPPVSRQRRKREVNDVSSDRIQIIYCLGLILIWLFDSFDSELELMAAWRTYIFKIL